MDNPIIVLKVGTSSVFDSVSHTIKVSMLARLAEAAVKLMRSGYNVIIVSSGAVGLGCARLGLKERPTSIAGKQAAAAVGQVRLMALYDDVFSVLGAHCAQVLLTYDTFGERTQYLHARNTFLELLKLGVVPIVNENDTVAVQELRVGDNDSLSALVAGMVGAQWLFLLTDVESLFTANPRTNAAAAPIRAVPPTKIHSLRRQMAANVPLLDVEADDMPAAVVDAKCVTSNAGSAFGTGGMITKLKAAQLATAAGTTVVITASDKIETIHHIFDESNASAKSDAVTAKISRTAFIDCALGTSFLPAPKPLTGRKRWILGLAASGTIVIDAGAVAAVVDARKSLFPAGCTVVTGSFEAQDAVALVTKDGIEVARALVNYNSEDCRKICGKRSKDVQDVLGYLGPETVADRDNIVVIDVAK